MAPVAKVRKPIVEKHAGNGKCKEKDKHVAERQAAKEEAEEAVLFLDILGEHTNKKQK